MKATGIVRRVDDLGRIVIPKEIRRTLRIREGDSLEIFTEEGGSVVFRKYSPVGEMSELAGRYSRVLMRLTGMTAVVCDRDKVIAAGTPSVRRELMERPVSPDLARCVQRREQYAAGNGAETLHPFLSSDRLARCISPILGAGDVLGCILLLQPDAGGPLEAGSEEQKLTQAAAGFLGGQLEE